MAQAALLAQARKSLGMSESCLAALCMMNVSHLRNIEAGRGRASSVYVVERTLKMCGAKI